MVGIMKRMAVVVLLSTTLASGAAEASVSKWSKLNDKLIKSPVFLKTRNILERNRTLMLTMTATVTGHFFSEAFTLWGMEGAEAVFRSFTTIGAYLLLPTTYANIARTERLKERLEKALSAALRSSPIHNILDHLADKTYQLENIGGYIEVSSEGDLLRILEKFPFDADALSALNNRTSTIVEENGGFPLAVIREGLLLNNGDFVSFTELYGTGPSDEVTILRELL